MTTLESDKVDRALRGKMKAERHDTGDWYYIVFNNQGIAVSTTSISKGSKHTLSAKRASLMARQLCLDNSKQFVDLVSCSLKREDALAIMETNCPPDRRRGSR